MDFKIDLHTHTLASGHAYNTIEEMVKAAKDKGMTHLGITDHAPLMPGSCHEFYFQNLVVVERNRDGMELLLGSEVNIKDFDGNVDLPNGMLKYLDVVIASLHTPCIEKGTMEQNTRAYIKAMENPYINIIGHPDDGRFPVDYEALVKAAKETGTLLEINNNSLSGKGPRKNTRDNDVEMLKLCMKYGVPVILGSDAHYMNDIANFTNALPLISELDFPTELIANSSGRMLENYLNKYKKGK